MKGPKRGSDPAGDFEATWESERRNASYFRVVAGTLIAFAIPAFLALAGCDSPVSSDAVPATDCADWNSCTSCSLGRVSLVDDSGSVEQQEPASSDRGGDTEVHQGMPA